MTSQAQCGRWPPVEKDTEGGWHGRRCLADERKERLRCKYANRQAPPKVKRNGKEGDMIMMDKDEGGEPRAWAWNSKTY
jgi:hypothetical protein